MLSHWLSREFDRLNKYSQGHLDWSEEVALNKSFFVLRRTVYKWGSFLKFYGKERVIGLNDVARTFKDNQQP